ncbi:MAG: hypothetical protein JSV00_07120, partial [bacterium]
GARALEGCALVYAVDPYPETFSALLQGKEVRDPFQRVFKEMVAEVEEGLADSDVAFLVPGDLTVFSPFLPLVERFGARARVIAGVGVLNAAAALLKRTLDMPGVSHTILLTSPKHIDRNAQDGELARLARAAGTMVLYMNNRPLEQLAGELSEGFDPDTPVAIASRLGMEGERIYRATLATMASTVGGDDIFGLASGEPSLAIILVGEVLEAPSDPVFWDRRKERFWDRKKGSA